MTKLLSKNDLHKKSPLLSLGAFFCYNFNHLGVLGIGFLPVNAKVLWINVEHTGKRYCPEVFKVTEKHLRPEFQVPYAISSGLHTHNRILVNKKVPWLHSFGAFFFVIQVLTLAYYRNFYNKKIFIKMNSKILSQTFEDNSAKSFKNVSFFGNLPQAHLPKKLPSFGVVYILELDNGLVKIGCSTQPAKRIHEIEKTIHVLGNLKIIRLVVSNECTNYHEVESQLHKNFKSYCVDGEWFKASIYDVIENLGEITLLFHSPTVTVGSDEIVTREFKGKAIRQRADGYFEATAMCKAMGKRFPKYLELKSTQEFLTELSSVTNTHIKSPLTRKRTTEQNQYLIDIIQGGIPEKQGSWIHPLVATNLAQWCRPQFAVQVSLWVFELMFTGEVSLLSPNNFAGPQDESITLTQKQFDMIKLGANLETAGLLHAAYKHVCLPSEMWSFEMMSNYWKTVNGEKLDEDDQARIKNSHEFTIFLCEQAGLPRKSISKLLK